MPKTRTSGQGRPKGVPNRDNRDIREMIVGALCAVGGTNYLARQAEQNPVAFMSLIGRVLPLQVSGEGGGALIVDFRWQDEPSPAPPSSMPYDDVSSLDRPGRAEPRTTTIDGNAVDVEPDTIVDTGTNDPPAITFISDC